MPKYLLVLILALFAVSCSLQMIPIRKQYRTRFIAASYENTFLAVKSALMKNGYKIDEMDFQMGQIEAIKIRKNKYLTISVKSEEGKGIFVKINLAVWKNGKRLSVSEKTMAELDTILNEINAVAKR
jgi:hypothetical protein